MSTTVPPRAAFLAVARATLEQIEPNARGVLVSDDPEFLHQLRVGLRRLRAALRAFRAILQPEQSRPLIRALRKLSPRLGTARDWDVLVARLEAHGGAPGLLRKARSHRKLMAQAEGADWADAAARHAVRTCRKSWARLTTSPSGAG